MSSETMQFIFSVIVCTTILVSIIPTLKENPNEKIDELKMEILKNSGYSAFKSIMMFLVTITFYSILVKYITSYEEMIISGNSIGLLMMYAIATYYMYYAYYVKKYHD